MYTSSCSLLHLGALRVCYQSVPGQANGLVMLPFASVRYSSLELSIKVNFRHHSISGHIPVKDLLLDQIFDFTMTYLKVGSPQAIFH